MTAEEFKSAARKLGITEVAANQTVELHEKFLRMGMTPASYEEILAAKQKKSWYLRQRWQRSEEGMKHFFTVVYRYE